VSGEQARASSHKEAPFIASLPKVDSADFYMFDSYETGQTKYVTILANYGPLQDPFGGPNYFTFDPQALYEIHIDNTGDAVEDITFQFRFSNSYSGEAITGLATAQPGGPMTPSPLIQQSPYVGATEVDDKRLSRRETYSLGVVRGPRRGSDPVAVTPAGGGTFVKPMDNLGPKTFVDYAAYAKKHIYKGVDMPGCKLADMSQGKMNVFVGQRLEGFPVNLGLVFDLINVKLGTIIDPMARAALNGNPDFDNTVNKNITTIALEVPAECLVATGKGPVIGGWTSASLRQVRVLNPNPTLDTNTKDFKVSREGGAWVQVSRLGNPLVNELVIGLNDKDRWNTTEPKDDSQYDNYMNNSVLAALIEGLFGKANAPAPTSAKRADLLAIFHTGIPGVNLQQTTAAMPVHADLLRLNTSLVPDGSQPYLPAGRPKVDLGAALCFPHAKCTTAEACVTPDLMAENCEATGFPNGRRPGDDVVDIALTAELGYFIPPAEAMAGGIVLHDAVNRDHEQFDTEFPYLRAPRAGDQQTGVQ